MTRLLLCTDLDRTLLPNGVQPESVLARQRFSLLAARDEVILVYVTGRHLALVQQAIKNYQLPQPDLIIADVGSSIYKLHENNWMHWQAWEDEISGDWQGNSHDDLRLLLKPFTDLRLQEASKQNLHKLSYYLPLYIDHLKLIDKITDCFINKGIHANFIWSIDEPANIGLLDVLPASAGKRQAIEFLMRELDFDSTETVFAGDSGNDICVLASSIQSVLVANASDEVRQSALQRARENGQENSLYLARGDFHDMNGNYSAGIIEGVVHYMPAAAGWMGINNEQ